MKNIVLVIIGAATFMAHAITATKEYVDRQDAAAISAATAASQAYVDGLLSGYVTLNYLTSNYYTASTVSSMLAQYLTISAATATYLAKSEAQSTYETKSHASSTYITYNADRRSLNIDGDYINNLTIESLGEGGRLKISGQNAGAHLEVEGDVDGGEIHVGGGMYSPAKINLTTRSGWEGAPDPQYQINGTNLLYFANKGAARPLPKYLHERSFDSVYPEDAQWYYDNVGKIYGSCSVRSPVPNWAGDRIIERNYDWTFDDTAEFVVRVSRDTDRFASIGIANVGRNLTEQIVISGAPSRYYKCLPGHMLDGINENGVVCEINVVGGNPHAQGGWKTTGTIHPLAAVRWALDHGTNAWIAATNLAEKIKFPTGWTQNFHYLVADNTSIYIVESGKVYDYTAQNKTAPVVMTNFRLNPPPPDTAGAGQERYELLGNANNSITNAWFTNAYSEDTEWRSEFETSAQMNLAKQLWNDGRDKESHRGETMGGETWWQTVHTSIYDIYRRALKIAVQEVDDWYEFTLESGFADNTDRYGVRTLNGGNISLNNTQIASGGGARMTPNKFEYPSVCNMVSGYGNVLDHDSVYNIVVGHDNLLSGSAQYGVVIGLNNSVYGMGYALGGNAHTAGWLSCAIGDTVSTASGAGYSFALGTDATVNYNNSFVWNGGWRGDFPESYQDTSHGQFCINPYGKTQDEKLQNFRIGDESVFGILSKKLSAPSEPITATAISYSRDHSALSISIGATGTLSPNLTSWPIGQSQTALITLAAGASISPSIKLLGYNQWPVGVQFLAECVRVNSTTVHVNPVSIIQ